MVLLRCVKFAMRSGRAASHIKIDCAAFAAPSGCSSLLVRSQYHRFPPARYFQLDFRPPNHVVGFAQHFAQSDTVWIVHLLGDFVTISPAFPCCNDRRFHKNYVYCEVLNGRLADLHRQPEWLNVALCVPSSIVALELNARYVEVQHGIGVAVVPPVQVV